MFTGCVDQRLWGKSADSLPGPYPLICHLLDTAAVAGALLDALLTADRVEWLAGQLRVDPAVCRDLVMFWAGLHDIGKITVPFQGQRRNIGGSLWDEPDYAVSAQSEGDNDFRHDQATLVVLTTLLSQLGYSGGYDGAAHVVAQLLGRHHGRIYEAIDEMEMSRLEERFATPLGPDGWQRERRQHVMALRTLIGPGAETPVSERPSSAAAAVVLGLVVCADWLASQESFITMAGRLPDHTWQAGDAELRAHWKAAVKDAGSVVCEAGLGRARFSSMPRSADDFRRGFGFAPNPLQSSLLSAMPDLVTGPGLLLITAPPGDGKTEASQLAVLHFHDVAGAGGFAYVLPTMATTDAMFRRAQAFANTYLDGQAALSLLHGLAWLNSDFKNLAESAEGGSPILTGELEDRVYASDWLRAGRRGILAPLGAMTIDQVLAGVLPVKHNLLRLFGLAGKTVVIDEAHSYGPWMHSLLVRLLEWLGAMQVPVVLMSATLTGRTAQDLVQAYRRGVLGRRVRPVEVATSYPGWLFVDGVSGEVSAPQAVGTDRSSRLHVECVKVASAPEVTVVPGRLEAIRQTLAPVAAEGGCVLVCCNTVAEAQTTFDFLAADLGERGVRVGLLHSRFRAGDRGQITAEVEELYGKPDAMGESTRRPPASVLVATQVVEQSIDLDFDLVISDLAPLALLLQRAGRGRRHLRKRRPAWTDPGCDCGVDEDGRDVPCSRLVVLEPVGADCRFGKPRQWGSVYFKSSLIRTAALLHKLRSGRICIPQDVQHLVDEVYAEDFVERQDGAVQEELAELPEADREYLATVMAENQLAANIAISSPKPKASDLAAELGGSRLPAGMEEFIVTRLGADSARALLLFDHGDGVYSLDPAGALLLSSLHGPVGLRTIMEHVVPVPGNWVRGHVCVVELPAAWAKNPLLSSLTVVAGRSDGAGGWRSTAVPLLTYDCLRGLSRAG